MKTHILSGIDELTSPWRTGIQKDFEKIPLEGMFRCIEKNFLPSKPGKLSSQNWRFTKQPNLALVNPSPEKVLEKQIARFPDPRWVNQVPAASGFHGSGDRKRSIDLVCQKADLTYVFYELKVLPTSGDALHAAIELLGYGLLYIYSRTRLLEAYKDSPLMKASTVHLRVLGTSAYYEKQRGSAMGPSRTLEAALSSKLNEIARKEMPECAMDFGFDTFPNNFSWSVEDRENGKKILDALAGIHPLFS